MELSSDRPNVVTRRTFSNAYGLAGMRIGYAVAHEPVVEALRKTAVPFGVSTVAQSAAVAFLDRRTELMERLGELVAERQRVREALLSQGWTRPGSQADFLWFRLGERTTPFAEHCGTPAWPCGRTATPESGSPSGSEKRTT